MRAAVLRRPGSDLSIEDVAIADPRAGEMFGATHVVDARAPDAIERVRALTGGRGVDRTVECTGHPSAVRLAYEATRPAGRIVIAGIAAEGAELCIPATGFPGSKKQIIGLIYGGGVPPTDMARIFALYQEGRLELDRQVGARVGLDRINDALRGMEDGALRRTIIEFPL